jgi:beta-lactam-binding protein with PASTA domain
LFVLKLKKQLKNYFKEIYYFFSSKSVLLHIAAMGGLIIALGLMFLGFINVYTNHGSKALVPNFVGMSIDKVETIADKFDFDIIVTDSVFRIDQKQGMVILQSPDAKTVVKPGRAIYVTITKTTPDEVNVPDIALGNDDYSLYSKRLAMLNIQSKIIERRLDGKLENNTIIDIQNRGKSIIEELKAGYKVPMGTVLDIIVSQREADEVNIGNFICKKFGDAEFMLNESNLILGDVVSDNDVIDKSNAFVYKQEPAYGLDVKVSKNTAVTLYLSKAIPKDCQ